MAAKNTTMHASQPIKTQSRTRCSATSEAQIKRSVMEALAFSRIFAIRQNSGNILLERNGRKRMLRAGMPGMADILALVKTDHGFAPVWIETKTETGRQSELQKLFEKMVVEDGHHYTIARNAGDALHYIRTFVYPGDPF